MTRTDPRKKVIRKCPTCEVALKECRGIHVKDGQTEHLLAKARIWRCEKCTYVRIYRPTLEQMLLNIVKTERHQLPLRVPKPTVAVLKARATEQGRSVNEMIIEFVRQGLGFDPKKMIAVKPEPRVRTKSATKGDGSRSAGLDKKVSGSETPVLRPKK